MAPRTGLSISGLADLPSQRPALPSLGAAMAQPRIVVRPLAPLVEDGRFPARAVSGQRIGVETRIFMDGHDRLAACVQVLRGELCVQTLALRDAGNDRWLAELVIEDAGRYQLRVEAWLDAWASWRDGVEKKREARQPLAQDLADALALIEQARRSASGADLQPLNALAEVAITGEEDQRAQLLLAETTAALMTRALPRRFLTACELELPVEVERRAAGYGAWYELFPRSQAADRHGTLDDVIGRLPAIRAMGFDVLYLPPIHPIGTTHRKGRNNSLQADPSDPGSPYAIGGAEGGHEAVHPELGGIEAFRRLRAAAADQDLELALDFAVQCSPDHPWLKQHPDWFTRRADGSIRYAENPPKKYEDIVNPDFYAPAAMPGLWTALRDIVLYWAGEGVRLFRVDNPHTKPLPFWQWLIAEVRTRHPDVLFLAEAFTRPAMMQRLAMIGFSQSYTYFTWRNTKAELTEYLTELTHRRGAPVFPPAPVRQHAGHQPLLPAVLRPRRLPDPRRAGRDAVGAVGPVQRLRAVRGRRPARTRGIPGFREVSAPPTRLAGAGQHHRRDHPLEPPPPRQPSPAQPLGPALLSLRQRPGAVLRQGHAGPRQLHPGGGEPGSAPAPAGAFRGTAVGVRPARRRRPGGRRADDRRPLPLARQAAALVRSRSAGAALRHLAHAPGAWRTWSA